MRADICGCVSVSVCVCVDMIYFSLRRVCDSILHCQIGSGSERE